MYIPDTIESNPSTVKAPRVSVSQGSLKTSLKEKLSFLVVPIVYVTLYS